MFDSNIDFFEKFSNVETNKNKISSSTKMTWNKPKIKIN